MLNVRDCVEINLFLGELESIGLIVNHDDTLCTPYLWQARCQNSNYIQIFPFIDAVRMLGSKLQLKCVSKGKIKFTDSVGNLHERDLS